MFGANLLSEWSRTFKVELVALNHQGCTEVVSCFRVDNRSNAAGVLAVTLVACQPVDSLSLQRTIETKQYNLESAEGCYSMALMYSRDIKAKYAVKVRLLLLSMPGKRRFRGRSAGLDWKGSLPDWEQRQTLLSKVMLGTVRCWHEVYTRHQTNFNF